MKATLCPMDAASPVAEIVLSRFPITLGRGTMADIRVADTIWSKFRGRGKRAARYDRPEASAANGAGDLA